MSHVLPLDQMTTEEKLRIMESIWEDLCRDAEAVPSPSWHAPILSEREERVRKGEERVADWEDAKLKIRQSLT